MDPSYVAPACEGSVAMKVLDRHCGRDRLVRLVRHFRLTQTLKHGESSLMDLEPRES